MADLYGKKLMDHYRNPRNRGIMENPTVEINATNPVCGDCTDMQLKVENGKIQDAKFESMGCAVSVAAASIMTEYLIGKSIEEAKSLTREKLIEMMEADLSPVKIQCAVMSLDALSKAIIDYEKAKAKSTK